MRIVNVILTSQNGGAEQAFFDYSLALKNLGHDVLAILKDDAPYVKQMEDLGIEVKQTTNKLGYHDFIAVHNIKKIITEFKADAIITHMSRSTILGKKALKKIKEQDVVQVAVNHSDNVKRSIGVDVILSVNINILARTVELGQSEEKSFVIPNAIDLEGCIENPSPFQLPLKETITIGGIGRLDSSKGFDELMRALKELEKAKDKKFVLKLAGSGYYEPELRALVTELGLEEKVEFLGWIKDKKAFFDSIDMFCLPSKNEPFGIVLLEAMKFAKPIIATDADGPKEILRDNVDALMVHLDKPDLGKQIADAALKLANSTDLADDLVKNASLKLKNKYSYQALEARMKEIFG